MIFVLVLCQMGVIFSSSFLRWFLLFESRKIIVACKPRKQFVLLAISSSFGSSIYTNKDCQSRFPLLAKANFSPSSLFVKLRPENYLRARRERGMVATLQKIFKSDWAFPLVEGRPGIWSPLVGEGSFFPSSTGVPFCAARFGVFEGLVRQNNLRVGLLTDQERPLGVSSFGPITVRWLVVTWSRPVTSLVGESRGRCSSMFRPSSNSSSSRGDHSISNLTSDRPNKNQKILELRRKKLERIKVERNGWHIWNRSKSRSPSSKLYNFETFFSLDWYRISWMNNRRRTNIVVFENENHLDRYHQTLHHFYLFLLSSFLFLKCFVISQKMYFYFI